MKKVQVTRGTASPWLSASGLVASEGLCNCVCEHSWDRIVLQPTLVGVLSRRFAEAVLAFDFGPVLPATRSSARVRELPCDRPPSKEGSIRLRVVFLRAMKGPDADGSRQAAQPISAARDPDFGFTAIPS